MSRVQLPKRVEEAVYSFAEKVCSLLGPGTVIYLFGSYARGDWLVDSDIDLIVVSPGLRGTPWFMRYPLLRKLASAEFSFDILSYTPEEFEEAKSRSIVLQDASRYWVTIRVC